MDLPFLFYGVGLAVAMVAASLTVTAFPDWQLARAALAVFANWLLGTLFAMASGVTDGWWFNILIDTGAAAVILHRMSSPWQALLGVTYCVQIAMHLAYSWLSVDGAADAMTYYAWLTRIAWAQLALLVIWSVELWRNGTIGLRARDGVENGDPPRGADPLT